MPKLTKTLIDSTQKADADVWVWDNELPGFGIRVQPTGRKTYVVRYRTHGGTQRKQTIARCTDMTPDRARDLARKAFATVAEGGDPAQAKRDLKAAPTVTDMKDRYMREHALPYKKPRSATEDERNWSRLVLPVLGKKKVRDVTKADILTLHGSLSATPAAANHALALLSKAFNLAEDWGWRDQNSNPCRRIKKFKIEARELILSPDQIAAADRSLDELVAERAITKPMAALFRLWLLTGCRNSEIRLARREWVDFNRRLLLLPDSKVGQRKIPLPDAAIDIIKELAAEYPDHKWLIPGRLAGEPLQHPWKMFKLICARAGIPPEARPHDLRHTVGSLGHHAGLSQKQIAQQLGHRQLSTTERYIHGIQSEQSKAAATIANVIVGNFQRKPQDDKTKVA